jgi:hypothetical protein
MDKALEIRLVPLVLLVPLQTNTSKTTSFYIINKIKKTNIFYIAPLH